jgi:glutamine synthetase
MGGAIDQRAGAAGENAGQARSAESAVFGTDRQAGQGAPAGWEEVERWLEARGVRIVHVLHADLFGRSRSKQYPLSELAALSEGIGYSKTSLAESLQGEMLPGARFPAEQGHPDVYAVGEPRSARVLPWQADTAWLLADLVEQHTASALCSRSALRAVCARLASAGLTPVVAAELEFYLLTRQDGQLRPYCDAEAGLSYSTGAGVDPGGVLGTLHRSLIDLGVGAGAATSEYSRGQFEVNLRHFPALAAADHAFLLKEATKTVAHRQGLEATFMAKPFSRDEGNSLHLHISLWRDEDNAFLRADGALSDLCLAFIAGLIDHAPALTAFASPTINSYKRLQPGGIVATEAGWGHDNRLAYVRVPQERGDSTRIEMRGGDASANPYLLTAVTLLAGLDGIERDLRPGESSKPLPRTLDAALDGLERDERLVARLERELVDTYVELKRLESARFAETVTDWEWSQYGRHA